MGRPGLYKTLFGYNSYTKKGGYYYGAMLDKIPNDVSTLFVDFNAIVHVVTSVIFATNSSVEPSEEQLEKNLEYVNSQGRLEIEEHIVQQCLEYLVQLCQYIKPIDCMVISVDSNTPLSKMVHQKARRYISAANSDEKYAFDSNAITPGTQLMFNIDAYIKSSLSFAETRKRFRVQKIIWSSHLVPGEGEHKMFENIRRGDEIVPNHTNGHYVIYGADADFVSVALMSNVRKIVISRDSVPIYVKTMNGISYDVKQRQWDKGKRNISIDNLRLMIEDQFKQKANSYNDFGLMVALTGNDFIPSPLCMKDFQEFYGLMLDVYLELRLPLTKIDELGKVKIIWKNFTKFLGGLISVEKERLETLAVATVEYKNDMLRRATSKDTGFDVVNFRRRWYANELRDEYPKCPKYVYPKNLDEMTPKDHVEFMCRQFLYGLAWTMEYYHGGQNQVTWVWYYPYHHAPMVRDLYKVCSVMEDIDVSPIKDEIRFNCVHQMIAVLPPLSKILLPIELQELHEKKTKLPIKFHEDIYLETDGIPNERLLWTADAIVGKIDYKGVIKTIAEMGFNPNRWLIWKEEEITVFEIEQEKFLLQMERLQTIDKTYGKTGPGGDNESMRRKKLISQRIKEANSKDLGYKIVTKDTIKSKPVGYIIAGSSSGGGGTRSISRGRGNNRGFGRSTTRESEFSSDEDEKSDQSGRGRGRGRGRGNGRGSGYRGRGRGMGEKKVNRGDLIIEN